MKTRKCVKSISKYLSKNQFIKSLTKNLLIRIIGDLICRIIGL